MEPEERDVPRAVNDSRKMAPPVASGKQASVEDRPSMSQRWNAATPTKMATFWLCLASVLVVVILGFTWGGWMTEGGAQKEAQTMAKNAVIERLAPICAARFSQDPDSVLKLDELNEMSSYQRAQYVRDQGWATISGEEKPNRSVADACTALILEMSP